MTTGGLALLTWILSGHAGNPNAISNIVLLFLLSVLIAAAAWGYVVGLWTAVLADLMVNFFFVPPLHTLTVAAPHNVLELLLFLAVAAIGAMMLSLLRRQVRVAEVRRAETNLMLELSQATAAAGTPDAALTVVAEQICRAFGAQRCRVLTHEEHGWVVAATAGETSDLSVSRDEASLADQALRTLAPVGRGSRSWAHLRRSESRLNERFVPFPQAAPEQGVLHLTEPRSGILNANSDQLLASYAAEASIALHRARLAAEAERADSFRRSDEFKSLLLTSLSHDLRSPLTAVKTAVSNLRDNTIAWTTEDVSGFLETIEEQTDRLTATVNDLLQLSRIEAGVAETSIEAVEVPLMLGDVVHAEAATTAGRAISIESPSGVWIRGDYRLLSQALGNLVENAARYSAIGGAIVLACTVVGDTTWLTVRDSGPIIALEDRPHLFERFFRGREAQQTSGTGLGLSIVAAIARLGGGNVIVKGHGQGNEIGFSVPSSEAP